MKKILFILIVGFLLVGTFSAGVFGAIIYEERAEVNPNSILDKIEEIEVEIYSINDSDGSNIKSYVLSKNYLDQNQPIYYLDEELNIWDLLVVVQELNKRISVLEDLLK